MATTTKQGPRRLFAFAAVLLAALCVGCGGDEVDPGLDSDNTRPDDEPSLRLTTIEQIQRDPRAWNEGPVLVRGTAYPRERGFLLVNDGASLWVAAPAGTSGLEAGDLVRVRGEVERITEDNARQVAQALRLKDDPGLSRNALEAIKQTPAEIGEPFLVLRRLIGEADPGA